MTVNDARPEALGDHGPRRRRRRGEQLRAWLGEQFARRTARWSSRTRAPCGSCRCGCAARPSWALRTSFVTMLRHPAEIVDERAQVLRHRADRRQPRRRLDQPDPRRPSTPRAAAPRAFVRYEDLLADWEPRGPPRRARCSALPDARGRRARRPPGGRRVRRPDAAPQPRRLGGARRARRACASSPTTSGSRSRRLAEPGGDDAALRGRRSTRRATAYRRALRGGGGDRAVVGRWRRATAAAAAQRARRRAGVAARAHRAPDPASATGGGCAARSGAAAAALVGWPPCRGSASSCRSTTSRTFLERAWTRSRAQTVDDLEVVMVDDGSTDGSAAIAEQYAERDEPLPARQPGERRPEQGAQHRHRRRRGRVPRVPRQRRRAAAERLRAAARRAREDRLGLRHRQRAPPHAVRHGRSRRSWPARSPRRG